MAKSIKHEFSRDVELNGVEMLMVQHKDFVKQSREKLFNGSKIAMVKGWTAEEYNDMNHVAYSVLKDDKELTARGYVLESQLKPSELDPDKAKPRYLYINRAGGLNKWQSGASGLQNTIAKGHDLIEAAEQTGKKVHAYTTAALNKYDIDVEMRKEYAKLYNGTSTVDFNKSYQTSIYNQQGKVSSYRYLMDEATKNRLLGKRDLAHKTYGAMYSSIDAKINTDIQNRKVLQMALDDYINEKATAVKGEFVHIGEKARDPKMRELWQMMPSNMRQDMQNIWGDKEIYVKKELINIIFGFRKLSFTDGLDKAYPKFLSNGMKYNMKVAGKIWQEIVKMAKRKVVILTPEVLIGNVISNVSLSFSQGLPIKYIFKEQMNAIKAIQAYQVTRNRRDKLVRLLELDPGRANAKGMQNQIARLNQNLETNIVTKLIDANLFQSIIEDVDPDEKGELRNIVQTVMPNYAGKLDKIESNVPTIVERGYAHMTLTPDVPLAQMLMKATQYSDFVARYAVFKYKTEIENMSEQKAVDLVRDIFINYDVNTSPEMQYLNDMGIMMYTKFLFRIQRTIFRNWKERPARAIMLQLAEIFIMNIPDIEESNLMTNQFIERMRAPGSPDTFDDAFTASLLNYIPLL